MLHGLVRGLQAAFGFGVLSQAQGLVAPPMARAAAQSKQPSLKCLRMLAALSAKDQVLDTDPFLDTWADEIREAVRLDLVSPGGAWAVGYTLTAKGKRQVGENVR